jgi:hypothetical protein
MSNKKIFGRTTLTSADFVASPEISMFRFLSLLTVFLLFACLFWSEGFLWATTYTHPMEFRDKLGHYKKFDAHDIQLAFAVFFTSTPVLLPIVMAIGMFVMSFKKCYQNYRRMPPRFLYKEYEVDEESLIAKNGAGCVNIWPWSSMTSVKIKHDKLIFATPASQVLSVPLNAFSQADRDWILDFTSRLPIGPPTK